MSNNVAVSMNSNALLSMNNSVTQFKILSMSKSATQSMNNHNGQENPC